jgi:hypothetical protein
MVADAGSPWSFYAVPPMGKVMKFLFKLGPVLLAAFLMTACDDGVFDNEAAQDVIEGAKIPLSGEQVILTPEDIVCGGKKGLWVVDQIDGGGAVGRLTDAGKALQFGDDIRMGDHRYSGPYTQLTGSHSVKVLKVDSMTDEKPNAKIVEAKVGVVMDHECFRKPLVLLGIDRGDFSEDVDPRFHLRRGNGWVVDQVLH